MAKIKRPQIATQMPMTGDTNGHTHGDMAPGDLAFSKLSEKIRAQFQSLDKDKKKKSQKRLKTPRESKNKTGHVDLSKSNPLQKVSATSPTRGKKRSHNGEVLTKPTTEASGLGDGEDDAGTEALKQEILALGGTAEDLSLIDGMQSDSEIENDDSASGTSSKKAQRDNGLEKGLTNIMKEIALAQRAAEDRDNSVSEDDADEEIRKLPDVTAAPPHTEVTVQTTASRTMKGNLSFEPRADWFNVDGPDVDVSKKPEYTLPRYSLDELHEYAKTLLDAEGEAYRKTHQSTSSQNFYTTVITSGTLSDKISALTLAVQESPLHNVKALDTLVALARKRSRAQAVDVLRALKDLFAQGSLLPSDRKLHNFNTQPELLAAFSKTKSWKVGNDLPRAIKQQHLISWAFESWLKETYFEVLKILEVWCSDEIEYSKSRAVSYVYELLKEKPEQEANLLRMLVNKLGDPVKKVASQTSFLIMQLMTAHPAMKETIISAVESEFLFRPGQSLHAKYYAVVTLNQTALSKTEESVAVKLLGIYFGLFVGLLKPVEGERVVVSGANAQELNGRHQKRNNVKTKRVVDSGHAQEDELRDKLTSAILTGINRAYPYTDASRESLSTHLDALFKITHSSNFNTGIQAMLLIQQLSSLHQASNDRFYRTLYESLLDARLVTSSKQSMYLNLLFRSLKADVNQKRVKAFAKRITQVLMLHQPSFICGAFFLLKELEKSFPGISGLIDQVEEHEDGEEAFHDVIEEEDLPQAGTGPVADEHDTPSNPNVYDGRKRDPEHSNAEASCLWELVPFVAHYHPSVALSADHLIRHAKLPGKPDLNLHTLIHFLDRFVYRNPKPETSNLRGSSIMQPMAASDTGGFLLSGATFAQERLPVNTNNFRTQNEGDVAPEDVFFHKYFSSLGKEKTKEKAKVRPEAEDGSVDADHEDEDEIWKAMMDSAPDLEGGADSDDDLEMEGLESDFEQSLEEMSDGLEEGVSERESMDDDAASADELDRGLLELDKDEDESEEELAQPASKNGKGDSRSAKSNPAREHRKKMKALPMFASVDDYAKILEDDEGEDLG